jgi:hypothetical protein
LNSGFDTDGVKTNIILYNRNTGICAYNARTIMELRINSNTLHNIRASGFKIGADTAATEVLDVAGNILASGSITASSAIINGVNIGSGLSSLETQIGGKQNTLKARTNITIDENNVISSSGGSGSDITQEDLDLKRDLITSSTSLTCNTINTQLGSNGTTNFINEFELTRAFAHNLQLNSDGRDLCEASRRSRLSRAAKGGLSRGGVGLHFWDWI